MNAIYYISPEHTENGKPCMTIYPAVCEVKQEGNTIYGTIIPERVYAHPTFKTDKMVRVYETVKE